MKTKTNKRKGNPGGRKKLEKKVLKSKVITIKLNPVDYDFLYKQYESKSKGLAIKFTPFLRNKLLNNTINYRHIDEAKLQLIKELNKIGTNINQMSRRINEDATRKIEVNQIDAFLKRIETIAKQII